MGGAALSGAVGAATGPEELAQTLQDPKPGAPSAAWPTVARGALPETKKEEEMRKAKSLGDAWVMVVREALCDTFVLHRIPQRYANHATHPLAMADPRHDRKEVLLPTLGLLREEGFSCLPTFSMESLTVLMDSPESTRWQREPDAPWLPMPTVAGETANSHGQIFLIGDSGWRVYRRIGQKGRQIEYLNKYLANWQFNPETYKNWSSGLFDCAKVGTGSILSTFVGDLLAKLAETFPDLWDAYKAGEDVQFPVSVVIGSCLNDAVRQSGDNWIIKPLGRDMQSYYADTISALSELLRLCRRACVVGFGTAEYWHIDPAFDDHANFCRTLFTERGIPVWDGDSLWESLAQFRGAPDRAENDEVDWWHHWLPECTDMALPMAYKRALTSTLKWLGSNMPAPRTDQIAAYVSWSSGGC